jgi:hypothetical protein
MSTNSKNKPNLLVELIPNTAHYSNVRTMLKPSEWDKLRKESYALANHKCEICGDNGKNQRYKHPVECHEIWEYDDEKHIQKLIGLISLCPLCHLTKNIGRAMAIGNEKICYIQLIKVNKWSQEQVMKHIRAAFELNKERSKHQWTLDISLLVNEPYNLKIDLEKERVFKVKTFKKKPKKKSPNAPKKIHPKAKIAAALKPKSMGNKKPPKK